MGQTAKEISGKMPHEGDKYSVFLLLLGWIISGLTPPPTPAKLWGELESALASSLGTSLGNSLHSLAPILVDYNLDLGYERKGYSFPPSAFSEQVACDLQCYVSNVVTCRIVK